MPYFRCVPLLAFLVLTLHPLIAADSGPPIRFGANWITHPAAPGSDAVTLLFRRQFELAEVPDTFSIAISADNHFRLYLNGAWVAFGPQLGDIDHYRFDRVDLRPYLRRGTNTLAVSVSNWGYHRMFGIQSVHTGLLIRGEGSSELLTTTGYDGAYRTRVDASVRPHRVRWRQGKDNDIIGGLYANNPTDSLYAGRREWGWQHEDYDDTDWEAATFLEAGNTVSDGSGFRWMLEPRRTPAQTRQPVTFSRVREHNLPDLPTNWAGGEHFVTIAPGDSARILLDLGAVDIGFPELRWGGGAGSRVKYTWVEHLFNQDGTKPHRDSVAGKRTTGYFDVVLADGSPDRSYTPSWYRAFRYLEINVVTGAEPLRLAAPVLQRVRSSVPLVAEWASDDAVLDSIVATGRRTVAVCTQDYFLSDAYYETMQYVGDTKVHALIWQSLTGDLRHTRNALLDFHHSRNPEGMLKSCYPLRHNFYHSSYSLVFVDMVYDYFAATADTAFVRSLLPGIDLTLAYFAEHYDPESGMLLDVTYKPFVDWYIGGTYGVGPGGNDEESVAYVLQYGHALKSAALLNAALGTENYHHHLQFQQLVERSRELFYDGERKLVAGKPDRSFYDQHATILGLLLRVVPEGDRHEALRRVTIDTTLSPATYYFRYYLFEAMRLQDDASLFRTALQPWYDMVGEGATTQVERFESPAKPTRSDAHPWGSAPTHHVYTLLVGITDRGYRDTVEVAPRFGHLRRMRGYYPLVGGGAITFSLERVGENGLRATLESSGKPLSLRWRGQRVTLSRGERKTLTL